jgi:hypothetical protein
LVRNSSSLPSVVEHLLSVADRRLGEGTSARFLAAFDATGLGTELRKPMLAGGGSWRPAPPDGFDPARIAGLRVENRRTADDQITLACDFPKAPVAEVFSRFVRSTSHANAACDFRHFPERCAPILRGPRYVAFHGDGHCFALANLLAALLHRLAGANAAGWYTVTSDRCFTHVFLEWNDGDGRKLLDADQKAMTDWDSVGPPFAMIFQIISMAGLLVFESIAPDDRRWLFAPATHEYFRRFHGAGPPPRIYRSSPTPQMMSALMLEARAHRLEPVSLEADDYPWKTLFRRACEGEELLSRMDEPLQITVPAGGSLAVGLDAEALPDEARLLSHIFFGRVPATVQANIGPDGRLVFAVPERPWLLCFPPAVREASVNGRRYATHRREAFSLLGAGDLDDVIADPGIAGNAACVVEGQPGATVRVVLPFNALAFNAGTLRIDCGAMATTYAVHH